MSEPKKPEVLRLTVANEGLLESPIYQEHRRGSNWLAIIDADPMSPGGLARRFMSRAKGSFFYLIAPITLFDPVEFAADYTTSTGRKQPNRWYGVVTAVTPDFLLIEKAPSGVKAVLRARTLRTSTVERAAALRTEREALLERADRLEEEARQLEIASLGGVLVVGVDPTP